MPVGPDAVHGRHHLMPRKLLILRHAKSAWDTDAPTDFERPLAKRGRKDAPRMGSWLRERGLIPDLVISSPAQRARETTLGACESMGLGAKQIAWEPRLYAADPGTLLEVLKEHPKKPKTLMIVGHNPGLELLFEHLCKDLPVPADGKLLPTATLAVLDMPDHWQDLGSGSAGLVSITRPRQLRET